MFILTKVGAEW